MLDRLLVDLSPFCPSSVKKYFIKIINRKSNIYLDCNQNKNIWKKWINYLWAKIVKNNANCPNFSLLVKIYI